jgi:hypothetical protein
VRPQPNLQGFADAQAALRDRFGQDVTFVIPTAATWTDPTDPQTGQPFDPWGAPASGGGSTEVIKHISVVSRPLASVRDDAQATPIGRLASDDVAFIVPFEEWDDIAGATHAIWLDDRYKITEVRDDAMATVYRRKIVYGTKA